MSATWATALLSTALMKKKESPIEAFKRTAELADEERNKAIVDLECATNKLLDELGKKIS